MRTLIGIHPETAPRLQTLIRAIRDFEGEALMEGRVGPDGISKPGIGHSAYINKAERLYQQYKGQPHKLAAELNALERSYGRAASTAKHLKLVGAAGLVFTASDVIKASSRSIEQRSFKPIAAESIRQAGGWGGSWLGTLGATWAGIKLGGTWGALAGLETGPGAVITGALGAIVGGGIGFFGADILADQIDEN